MTRLLNIIDNLLNRITMYRLMLYFLLVLFVLSVFFSFIKLLPYSYINLITSGLFLIIGCLAINQLTAFVLKVRPNFESQFITALILSLIVGPLPTAPNLMFLSLVAVFAMMSKYVIVYKKQHIFNPTAVAVTLTAVIMGQGASWWIGNNIMLPFILLGGLLIARKLRRFHLIFSFLASYALFLILFNFNSLTTSNFVTYIFQVIFSPVILFFTFVMLTEPITSPADRKMRIYFGIFTAFIYVLFTVLLNNMFYSLELSLVSANLLFRIISFTEKYSLVLREKKEIAESIWEFLFEPTKPFAFIPGQYLEWSLPHSHTDARGNRRYFTIASSPTERSIKLDVKIPEKSSTFKKALLALKPGEAIYATNLEGEFVLEKDESTRYVFIAGGIGITPYLSIIQYLLDKKLSRDITLFYIAKSEHEFVYKKLLEKAHAAGVKVVYVLSENSTTAWKGEVGRLDENMLEKHVPDFKSCLFYVSGPQPMVMAYEELLQKIGGGTIKYKADFFSGYKETYTN